MRSGLDTLVYRYTSVLLAQPFDVAKTLLQVCLVEDAERGTATPRRRRVGSSRGSARRRDEDKLVLEPTRSETDESTNSSDDDNDGIPDYFTANRTLSRSRSPRKRRRTPPPSTSQSPTPRPSRRKIPPSLSSEHSLHLRRPSSITHALSQLYLTSGALGLWRGTNASFLYTTALRTTETFIRSLLLALSGLPETDNTLDLADNPHALTSLLVVGVASALTGLLLSPLDTLRTRLIVTPGSQGPRGLVQSLRQLPSLLAPVNLWLPTALAGALPQLFSAGTPLLLRRQLKLTPESSPSLWSIAAFGTQLGDLFLRLPFETLVRRAQVASLREADPGIEMLVPVAPYQGVWGTVYGILYVEGETRTKDAKTGMVRVRRGQGTSGLVRGWRVGFWGLVGVWGAGVLGGREERRRGEF